MNHIRFHVYDGDNHIHSSEWVEESTRTDAGVALANARQQFGDTYAYRIERTGDSKTPNPVPMIRFQIKIGDVVFLSKIVPESEKDELLAALKSGEDIKRVKSELGLTNLKSLEAAEFTEVRA